MRKVSPLLIRHRVTVPCQEISDVNQGKGFSVTSDSPLLQKTPGDILFDLKIMASFVNQTIFTDQLKGFPGLKFNLITGFDEVLVLEVFFYLRTYEYAFLRFCVGDFGELGLHIFEAF